MEHVIASKSDRDGKTIYWQGGPWWGHRDDAKCFTEEEARKHEKGFNDAGVHRVWVEPRVSAGEFPTYHAVPVKVDADLG